MKKFSLCLLLILSACGVDPTLRTVKTSSQTPQPQVQPSQPRLVAVADLRRSEDNVIILVIRDTRTNRDYLIACGTQSGGLHSGNGCGVTLMARNLEQ